MFVLVFAASSFPVEPTLPSPSRKTRARRRKTSAVSGRGIRTGGRHWIVKGPKGVDPGLNPRGEPSICAGQGRGPISGGTHRECIVMALHPPSSSPARPLDPPTPLFLPFPAPRVKSPVRSTLAPAQLRPRPSTLGSVEELGQDLVWSSLRAATMSEGYPPCYGCDEPGSV